MTRVANVVDALNQIAPFRSAYAGDPVGLQIGDPSACVERAVVSLDRSVGAISRCVACEAQLLVCHHPLIFRPLPSVTSLTQDGKAVLDLARHGIAFIAAHTNWDCAKGGVNDELARLLGLTDVQAFGDSGPSNETKLVVFAPVSDADRLIDALSSAGAGQIGNYRRCAFIGSGTGTYVPGDGASPYIGEIGRKESVEEVRIEMVVPNEKVSAAIQALIANHPYEEPAFDLIPLADKKPWPIARVGLLAQPLSLRRFIEEADRSLETRSLAWGDPDKAVCRIAVCGGSGADLWRAAQNIGADVLVTGECPQHVALEASDSGFAIISSGHYATENPGARALKEALEKAVPEVGWEFYEPEPGNGGRPFFV